MTRIVPKNRAVAQVVERKAPTGGGVYGTYIRFAVANMAGKAFGKEVPSFRKPYFLFEQICLSERDKERAMAELDRRGYFI
jgi:hypothetical protein